MSGEEKERGGVGAGGERAGRCRGGKDKEREGEGAGKHSEGLGEVFMGRLGCGGRVRRKKREGREEDRVVKSGEEEKYVQICRKFPIPN